MPRRPLKAHIKIFFQTLTCLYEPHQSLKKEKTKFNQTCKSETKWERKRSGPWENENSTRVNATSHPMANTHLDQSRGQKDFPMKTIVDHWMQKYLLTCCSCYLRFDKMALVSKPFSNKRHPQIYSFLPKLFCRLSCIYIANCIQHINTIRCRYQNIKLVRENNCPWISLGTNMQQINRTRGHKHFFLCFYLFKKIMVAIMAAIF